MAFQVSNSIGKKVQKYPRHLGALEIRIVSQNKRGDFDEKLKYSAAQIIGMLKQAEGAGPVGDLCREYGLSSASFYNNALSIWNGRQLDFSDERVR